MAIRDALQSASIKLIGRAPATFFDSTDKFSVEISDMANEVAIDVAKYQDWQQLVRVHTITSDGIQTEYPFPDDYDRMMQTSRMQDDTAWAWNYGQMASIDDFLAAQTIGLGPWPGVWIIYDNKFHFWPAPPAGETAKFTYITKNWAINAGTPADKFTSDLDEYVLPERLLMLGLVWRYRENKGLAADGAQEAFIKAMDEYAGKSSGPFVLRKNWGRRFRGTFPAYPIPLGYG